MTKKKRSGGKWNEIMSILGNILGYNNGQKFPTILPKKISELREGYSDDVIIETILRSTKDIQWAIHNKEFDTDYNMCAYISAIIINKINDVKKEMEHIELAKKKMFSTNYDECVPEDFSEIGSRKVENKDLTSLFEGESWM